MNRLDLNLLVALDALLQERSVTRAAERLEVTQPTMSASLARLRRHFNDELLYRSGNTYDLTPLATQLCARTGPVLAGVKKVFAVQSAPDPSSSEREFLLICSDYGAAVVGPPLMARLAARAPGVRLLLQQSDPGSFTTVEERLRSVDGLIMPHGFIQNMPHLDLYRDEWVCLVCADNVEVGDELTMEDLARLPWAVNFRGPSSSTTAVRHMAQLGVQISMSVVVNAFLLLPSFVIGTNRIAIAPRRLAEGAFVTEGLRLMECPFDPGPVVEALWWHPDFERDAEHIWFRQLLAEVAQELAASGSG